MTPIKKKILITFSALLAVVLIAILVFLQQIYRAESDQLAKFYQQNADSLIVTEYSNYWQISPKNTDCADEVCVRSRETGFIYYPGALVEPQAYFYKQDFLANDEQRRSNVFITKPPLYLAIFGINQATEIISNNPDIKRWVIGGHSLGGAMACEYAKNHTDRVSTLVMIGAYCSSNISDTNLTVITIHGSEDGILNMEKFTANAVLLPSSATNFTITGMNHAQAGDYGEQKGDNPALVSDEQVKDELKTIYSTILN